MCDHETGGTPDQPYKPDQPLSPAGGAPPEYPDDGPYARPPSIIGDELAASYPGARDSYPPSGPEPEPTDYYEADPPPILPDNDIGPAASEASASPPDPAEIEHEARTDRELIVVEHVVLTPREIAAAEAVGRQAIDTVDERYGTGYPHFEGGENGGLANHNGHHTRAVTSGSERMGERLELPPTGIIVSKTAAAAHDIVQLKPRGVMERESAEWYEEQLREHGLPAVAATAGGLAIKGTEPIFDDKYNLVGQKVSEMEFPSRGAELIAKSVGCADFGELYASTGPYVAHRLFQEIEGKHPQEAPPMDKLVAFQTNQVLLTHNYRYPHPAGEEVFGGLRGEVTRYHEDVLRRIEAGEIHSWEQLLEEDLAFANRHA